MKLSIERFMLLVIIQAIRTLCDRPRRNKPSCTHRTYRGSNRRPFKRGIRKRHFNANTTDFKFSDDQCTCPPRPAAQTLVWIPTQKGSKSLLDAGEIPQFVEDLVIPPVLFDDKDEDSLYLHKHFFHVALRQIESQVLPNVHGHRKFPKTKLWGYGDPDRPDTFSNPAGTIEVSKDHSVDIVWINELVVDPYKCRTEGDPAACNHLPHIVQDKNGVPLVDPTLAWANPSQACSDGERRTDCRGNSSVPYNGPVPMVIHNHGAHAEAESDGYPEAWSLPDANTIPEGYAKVGKAYEKNRRKLPSQNSILQCNADDKSYAVFRYTNDQPSTTLFYHDHTLGLTRLNVYAAGAGAYIIRDRRGHSGETFLKRRDCNGNKQQLPGPPPRFGQDPNRDRNVRRQIREIPLIIKDMQFYDDGSLWYPADPLWIKPDCYSPGDEYPGSDVIGNRMPPFLPDPDSDIHPVASVAADFDTIVVNGKTWPKLNVAPERYRFRIVNGADSRIFNLALKINYQSTEVDLTHDEVPFYIIGSDQGLLPVVSRIKSCARKEVEQCPNSCVSSGLDEFSAIETDQPDGRRWRRPHKEAQECELGSAALVISPGERYDVIVDFNGLQQGDTVTMVNTGPDAGLVNGTWPLEKESMANASTTGNVMKFFVDISLKQGDGSDRSTPPECLQMEGPKKLGNATKVRDLALRDVPSEKVCGSFERNISIGQDPIEGKYCEWKNEDCSFTDDDGSMDEWMLKWPTNGFSPKAVALGVDAKQGGPPKRWIDPITENPRRGAVEIWDFYSFSRGAHPIHVHLVEFEVLNHRFIKNATTCMAEPWNCPCRINEDDCFDGEPIPAHPWEKRKDTVLVLPGQVTRVKLKFDLKGRYAWHCHILSHEDNDMMRPICVGDLQEDCGQNTDS